MPIVIFQPQPGELTGPYLPYSVTSDFVGPILTPQWKLEIVTSDDIHDLWQVSIPTTGPPWHINGIFGSTVSFMFGMQTRVQDGGTVLFRATLQGSAGPVEVSSVAAKLDDRTGRIYQTYERLALGTTGSTPSINAIETNTNLLLSDTANLITGITSTVETLAGTVSATIGEWFSGKTLDQIAVVHVTSSPTCDPFEHSFGPPDVIYGLIVQCTSIPPWYAFTSPGQNWTPRNLATLTITRGDNLLARYGVHTDEFTVYPLPGVITIPVSGGVPVTPPSYHVRVDWGEGVCGELLAMVIP